MAMLRMRKVEQHPPDTNPRNAPGEGGGGGGGGGFLRGSWIFFVLLGGRGGDFLEGKLDFFVLLGGRGGGGELYYGKGWGKLIGLGGSSPLLD